MRSSKVETETLYAHVFIQKIYMLMSLCIRNLLQESYNFQSIIDLLFTNDNFMQNRFSKLSVDESKSIYTIWANKADIAMKY